MIATRWFSVVVLGLASTLGAATPPPFGDWTPRYSAPGINICINTRSCASNTVKVSIASISEFSNNFRTDNTVQKLNSSKLRFTDPSASEYDNDVVTVERFASLAIPVNSSRSPYSLPTAENDPVLTVRVQQLMKGRLPEFNDTFNIPVETSAVQVEFAIHDWPFEDWMGSLEVELAVVVPGGAKLPLPQYTNPTSDVIRVNTSDRVQYDFPRVSIDKYGNQVTTDVGVYKLGDEYRVTLRFRAGSVIKYTFLLSPTSPKLSSPAFPTRLKTFPGGFEYCSTSNCNIRDGSFSLLLGQLGHREYLTYGYNTTYSSELSNFAKSAKDLVFVDQNASAGSNTTKSLFLSIPWLGGTAVLESQANYTAASNPNMIYMNVSIEHVVSPSNITANSTNSNNTNIEIPLGGAKMSIEIVFPDFSSALMYQNLTLTFFVSAFEKGKMVENVTTLTASDGTSSRIVLGRSMHLAFPASAWTDSYTYPVSVEKKLHTSGEYEGLTQFTLLLSHFSRKLVYTLGISSTALDNGEMGTTPWMPASTAVVPGFENIKTKLLTHSHGEFGLCLEDGSCADSSVKMGFTGLGTSGAGGNSTQFGRFAQAQAFEFGDPVLVSETIKGRNVTKWTTGFRAFIPQSQLRPPIPFDPALAAASTLPQFAVQIDQYLNAGKSENGDQEIYVPSGALKFSFNLTNWVFASPSDELVLNITLAHATGSDVSGLLGFVESIDNDAGLSRTVVNISSTVATVAEFPLFAVVDGKTKPVSITPSFDMLVGVVVTMRFPWFNHSLYYDPVLSSTTPSDDAGMHMNLRSQHLRSGKRNRVAIVLLAALAFVVVLSIMRCAKRVSVKIDFSKVIP